MHVVASISVQIAMICNIDIFIFIMLNPTLATNFPNYISIHINMQTIST